jgi:SAM-dependent methyltransferase
VEILNYVASTWRSDRVHESSPGTNHIALKCKHYSYSFYFDSEPLGKIINGQRCESLEAMTFADNSFDVFITQDVLEHVFRPDLALAEIMRVLRPNGVHVFTAPKHQHLLKTVQRATLVDGQISHLLPPQYHGNPIDPKGSLVTWDYGADFETLVQQWSGYSTSNYTIRDRGRGIDGEYLDVFVTKKDAVNRQI